MVDDPELDELRRQRAQELRNQTEAQQQQAEDQEAEVEAMKSKVLWRILEPEARERLATLKMARPEFAKQIENRLIALAQSGRLGDQKITDEVLKEILARSSENKRDINIERR